MDHPSRWRRPERRLGPAQEQMEEPPAMRAVDVSIINFSLVCEVCERSAAIAAEAGKKSPDPMRVTKVMQWRGMCSDSRPIRPINQHLLLCDHHYMQILKHGAYCPGCGTDEDGRRHFRDRSHMFSPQVVSL